MSSALSSSSSSTLLQPLDLAADFGGKGLVPFGQFEHAGQIAAGADDLLERLGQGLERFELADDFASLFLIVPEIGLAHAGFDRCDLSLFVAQVKESLVVG